jgi:hypothetical protein
MSEDKQFQSFGAGIKTLGLTESNLRVEGFRTDGTSNYLVNLNYRGQTWAAVLRLPAIGASLREFLAEKEKALSAANYLLNVLQDGIDVGFGCTLNFSGYSCFVDGESTQRFFHFQSDVTPLVLIDKIHQHQQEIASFKYPESLPADTRSYISNYNGPFYLSRGAPAWETLEEYPGLEEPVAHALAALHLATGSGEPVSYEASLCILREIEVEISHAIQTWSPSAKSKEGIALNKSLKNWYADTDPERTELTRRERFVRTLAGKTVFDVAFNRAIAARGRGCHELRTFCHGDCHGGNFILVRYEFTLSQPGVLLDRVFLNEVFEKDKTLQEVSVSIKEENSSIVVSESGSGSPNGLKARRNRHYEIHLVDLDNVRGTTEDTKQLHIYDALFYSMSMANLSRLFGSPVESSDILRHYYDGLRSKS